MNDLIYYHEFDEPKVITENISGRIHTSTEYGELCCTDPRVEKVWEIGYLTVTEPEEAKVKTMVMLKNGNRSDFKGEWYRNIENVREFLKTQPNV